MSQQVEVIEEKIPLSDPQLDVVESRAAMTLNMAGQGGGKSFCIGLLSGSFVQEFPQVKQFIGANTYLQLTQSTLAEVMSVWEKEYGLTEWDAKKNPAGSYIIDKRPPLHFDKIHKFKEYNNIISFWNGAIIFTGSLENYKAHEGKAFGIAHLDETKDTEERALKDVILGRLRQYGLWYDETGEIYFAENISAEMSKLHGWVEGERFTPEHAAFLNWTSWNPLYVHTSPASGGTPWLIEMFKLTKMADQIKKEVLKKQDGYFFKRFENKCVVIYSTYHNLPNLPPNYIETQLSTQTEEGALRVVYGFPFGKTGGEYFPRFSRPVHVKPTPFLAELPVCCTWDFNVVPYMTLLCAQIDFVTRYLDELGQKHEKPEVGYKALEVMVIRFYKEYCLESPRNTTQACCEAFSADHNPNFTSVEYYGDASGNDRIPGLGSLTNYKIVEEHMFPFLHNHSKKVKKFNVLNVHRRDLLNKIFEGKIPTVEIQIDPDCELLIKDFEEVKEGPKGKVKKRVKNEDTGEKEEETGHCFVGSTLITTDSGQKRIDEIKIGDLVLTRHGYKPVLKVFDNGIREVIGLSINGGKIECTPDHLFYTKERGFTKANLLMPSDTLCIFDEIKNLWQYRRFVFTGDSNSEDTPNQTGQNLESILLGFAFITETEKRGGYMSSNGFARKGRFQRATTFTTLMRTRLITTFQTLLAFLLKITCPGIGKTRQTNKKPLLKKFFWKRQYQHQRLGTEVNREIIGIRNTQRVHSLFSPLKEPALDAELSSFKPIYQTPDFVRPNAKTHTIQCLQGKRKRQRVFDIQVQDEHEYFANGVLVHNCSDAAEYLICEICKEHIKAPAD